MLNLKPLSSPDWRQRKQAMEALAGAGDETLAQGLLEIVRANHQDLGALNAALQLLSRLSVPVAPGLVRLLGDPDPEARLYAALALGELGDDLAEPYLLEALDDPHPNVTFNAIEALGKLRSRQAVEPLVARLQSRDFYLAFPAVEALAEIGDPAPLPFLLDALPDEHLGSAAARALGALGEPGVVAAPLAAWLESSSGETESAVLAFQRLGERSGLAAGGKTTPSTAANQDPAGERRRALLRQIAGPLSAASRKKLLEAVEKELSPGPELPDRLSSDAENPLQPGAEALEQGKIYLAGLARVLGWLLELDSQDTSLQAALLELLNHPAARRPAAEALTRLGELAIPGLSTRLDDPDPEVRYAAARALGAIAKPPATPALQSALEAALESGDEPMAVQAAQALGRSGDPAAYEPLSRHLPHPSAVVRHAVACALHELNVPEHVGRMVVLIDERNPDLCAAALHCLALEPSLEGDDRLREAILKAIETGSLAVQRAAAELLSIVRQGWAEETLARSLNSPQPALRAAAARALSRSDSAYALPRLQEALQDPDLWTRLYACRSLGHHARPESLPALASLASDPAPPVRIALAEALGKFSGRQAVAVLERLAGDGEVEVRQAAGRELDKIFNSGTF